MHKQDRGLPNKPSNQQKHDKNGSRLNCVIVIGTENQQTKHKLREILLSSYRLWGVLYEMTKILMSVTCAMDIPKTPYIYNSRDLSHGCRKNVKIHLPVTCATYTLQNTLHL
jgi:hypothetical protein